jgi:hypothetical protein
MLIIGMRTVQNGSHTTQFQERQDISGELVKQVEVDKATGIEIILNSFIE